MILKLVLQIVDGTALFWFYVLLLSDRIKEKKRRRRRKSTLFISTVHVCSSVYFEKLYFEENSVFTHVLEKNEDQRLIIIRLCTQEACKKLRFKCIKSIQVAE